MGKSCKVKGGEDASCTRHLVGFVQSQALLPTFKAAPGSSRHRKGQGGAFIIGEHRSSPQVEPGSFLDNELNREISEELSASHSPTTRLIRVIRATRHGRQRWRSHLAQHVKGYRDDVHRDPILGFGRLGCFQRRRICFRPGV